MVAAGPHGKVLLHNGTLRAVRLQQGGPHCRPQGLQKQIEQVQARRTGRRSEVFFSLPENLTILSLPSTTI